MKIQIKSLLCSSFCITLMGCAGESGSDGDNVRQEPLTFNEQISVASRFADEIEVLDIVEATNIPNTGSATYSGNLGVSLARGTPSALVVYGDLNLTSDFANSAVSGQVTNLVSNNDSYQGRLDLENGEINRMASDNRTTLTADLTGDLTTTDSTTLTSNASLTGGFYGAGESHVSGTVQGNVLVNNVAVPISNGAFSARD